ncbi:hypothetical protein IFM89_010115 [Coptis chinensis]|uniref:Rad60/SUMO-like domain-containing protein n=1 Tax=Coptis chinensis TaxID=261450 RepID=A0A835HX89_9MAGN|nr:hypothetical protein IFM89_010115 [Coptis chinensis]
MDFLEMGNSTPEQVEEADSQDSNSEIPPRTPTLKNDVLSTSVSSTTAGNPAPAVPVNTPARTLAGGSVSSAIPSGSGSVFNNISALYELELLPITIIHIYTVGLFINNHLDQTEVSFTIKSNVPLQKLMDAYCKERSVEVNSLRFMIDGKRLRGHQYTDDVAEVHRGGLHDVITPRYHRPLFAKTKVSAGMD